MKAYIVLLFCIGSCTVWGQVPEMEPRDSTFLRAIDIFLDSLSSHNLQSEHFVVGAEIRKLEVIPRPTEEISGQLEYPESNYKWSYQVVLMALKDPMVSNQLVASGKFNYRNREVYLYFGGEFFAQYSKRDRKKLKRTEPRGWDGVGRFEIGIAYLMCKVEFSKINVFWFKR